MKKHNMKNKIVMLIYSLFSLWLNNYWIKLRDYWKFQILITTDFRDRSLSGIWIYKWKLMEFKNIDEYLVKIDWYFYDRYEIRQLFWFKKHIVDLKMFDHKIKKWSYWYQIIKEIKNRWKTEYSEVTWKYK